MFDFAYFDFDFQFDTHSEVIGYVVISSKIEKKEGLVDYVRDIESRCYPTAKKAFSRGDSNVGNNLVEFVKSRERTGTDKLYIETSKDVFILRWRN